MSNRKTAPEGPGAYAIDEAADFLRVSRASVWRLLKGGEIPRVRIGGRTVIRRVDLDAFLARAASAA